jgi:hypothetical protein
MIGVYIGCGKRIVDQVFAVFDKSSQNWQAISRPFQGSGCGPLGPAVDPL